MEIRVQMVPADSDAAAAIHQVFLRETEKTKYRPGTIVKQMKAEGFTGGFVTTERMVTDMGAFGFDASRGLGVDVPGSVCAYLAAHPTPMNFSGRNIDAPTFAVDVGLVDGTKLPPPYGPSHWGAPGRTVL